MKKKEQKSNKNIFKIVLAFLFVLAILFGIWFFQSSLRNLNLWIFNIHDEIGETHRQIEELKSRPMPTTAVAQNFVAKTRNWLFFENQNYDFQFKNPFDWGLFNYDCVKNLCVGNFVNQPSHPEVEFGGYDLKKEYEYIKNLLPMAEPGSCRDDLFEMVKKIRAGELRFCETKENVLGQKYLMYRFFDINQPGTELSFEAFFPNKNWYIIVRKLVMDEGGENFLTGFIFQNQ